MHVGVGQAEGADPGGALRTELLVGDDEAGTTLRPLDWRDAVLVLRLHRVDPGIVNVDLDPVLLESGDEANRSSVAQSGPLSLDVSLSRRTGAPLGATTRSIVDLINPEVTKTPMPSLSRR